MDVLIVVILWFVASLDIAIAIEYAKIIIYKKANQGYTNIAWFVMITCTLISGMAVYTFIKGLGVL